MMGNSWGDHRFREQQGGIIFGATCGHSISKHPASKGTTTLCRFVMARFCNGSSAANIDFSN
jgi:hypothetical protein